jgi:DNA-binding transcriptional LysR family regulator
VLERLDCVLRAGEPQDSTMVARRLALLPQVTCASAAYLQAHGTPASVEELAGHQAVNFASGGKVVPFEFVVDGAPRKLTLRGKVTVSHADAYVLCCEAGLGLIQAPRYHVERQLAAGTLVEVLPVCRPPPMPVSVLYPHHRQLSPRVRVFVDWAAERFRGASAPG